ncbi:MAG: hypothetical protein KAJ91_03865, partial [Candidatus Aenigmarchaeota archaeon]|nr:hypothetical protein [Candidatus Aenigmarchaeota archaeon]
QFNFTANCTETEKQMFRVASERDTRNTTSYFDSVSYSCSSGEACSTEIEPLFDSPSMPYQKISNINMSLYYEWSANNITIGEGYVYLKDDDENQKIFWQNYSLFNYGSDVDVYYWPASGFVSATRKINLFSHADGTEDKFANVTISKINYTWDYGKIFSELTDLFVKSKIYTYTPLVINSTLYISADSSATLGGWGEEFNFSVEVRDRFGRDVEVYLWHKTSAASVYTLVASDTCSSCGSWTVMNFTYDYQPDDMDTWVFKFNTTNDDGATELAGHTYIIEEDNVSVTSIWPPLGAVVNRSVSTTFSIRAFDTDNQTYANNSNSKIWLDDFTYGSYESAPPILTSDDGWINRTLTNVGWCADTGKWFLGNHSWYGGTSADAYVFDNVTAIQNVTLMADLSNSAMSSFSQNFTRGSNIAFSGTVTDDCSSDKTDPSKFGIEFRMEHGGAVYGSCATTSSFGCSINTDSGYPYGWYNITHISFSKDNPDQYWNGTTLSTNEFFLSSIPQSNYMQVSPLSDGWSRSPFNLTINVSDEDNDTVTVNFYLKKGAGTWALEDTWTCQTCNDNQTTFQRNFTQLEIDTWHYIINASDQSGNINSSLQSGSFTVEKDDVAMLNIDGNNSVVNRTGASTRTLALRLYDSDNTSYTTNLTTTEVQWFIRNNTGNTIWNAETTDSKNTTHYYFDFNPDSTTCDYPTGKQEWKVNISSIYFYNNDTESFTKLHVNIYGSLNNNIDTPDGNTNYTQGVSIGLRGNTTDDCTSNMTGLSTMYFNLTNQRTGTTETCGSTEEEGDGWYNCTWDSIGKDTGYYTVTMFSNESYYNYGNTTALFYLSSTPVFEDEAVVPTTGGWGASPYNYTVNVTDVDNDTLTISFWLNGTGLWVEEDTDQCENCSDTVMNFTNTYTCSDIGAWYYKFNTTDPNNNPAESSLNWHNVTEDKISLNLEGGNNSEINRSSGTVNLSITVYDYDALSNTIDITTGNISFWFQNETGVWKEETYDNKNSTEYYIDFNPGCDYDVGIRTWKANQTQDTCYSTNQTDEFVVTVYGSINNLIISP